MSDLNQHFPVDPATITDSTRQGAHSMITRTLGRSGLDVSAIGFGCMGLSHAYGLDVAEQDGIAEILATYLRRRHHSRSPGSDRALDRHGDLCG
jgi:hypothetical protein